MTEANPQQHVHQWHRRTHRGIAIMRRVGRAASLRGHHCHEGRAIYAKRSNLDGNGPLYSFQFILTARHEVNVDLGRQAQQAIDDRATQEFFPVAARRLAQH